MAYDVQIFLNAAARFRFAYYRKTTYCALFPMRNWRLYNTREIITQ